MQTFGARAPLRLLPFGGVAPPLSVPLGHGATPNVVS